MSKDIRIKKGLDLKLVGEAQSMVAAVSRSQVYSIKPSDFHKVTPKLVLKEGAEVKAGEVIFYSKDDRLAIVGDVLFAGSIGRTDFPRGNLADLIRSIREKLFPLGDDIAFIPGHGPISTFGEERKNNPYVGEMAN